MLCRFQCSSNLLISGLILYSQLHLIDENISVEKDRVKNKKSIRKPHRTNRGAETIGPKGGVCVLAQITLRIFKRILALRVRSIRKQKLKQTMGGWLCSLHAILAFLPAAYKAKRIIYCNRVSRVSTLESNDGRRGQDEPSREAAIYLEQISVRFRVIPHGRFTAALNISYI